ncbi:hypothetical protein ID866_13170, partial [Astraeus odoratus]
MTHHTKEQDHILSNAAKTNLAAIQGVAKDLWKQTPMASCVWKSIRSRDIPKQIRNFLWKGIHGKYKIGSYW